MRTREEIQSEYSEVLAKREQLVKEYKKTHTLPSRGRITDPEILKLEEKMKELGKEYFWAQE